MQDPDAVAAKQEHRAVTHADPQRDRPPQEEMGTTSTTRDPAPRDRDPAPRDRDPAPRDR
jgi:hypothetical protein